MDLVCFFEALVKDVTPRQRVVTRGKDYSGTTSLGGLFARFPFLRCGTSRLGNDSTSDGAKPMAAQKFQNVRNVRFALASMV